MNVSPAIYSFFSLFRIFQRKHRDTPNAYLQSTQAEIRRSYFELHEATSRPLTVDDLDSLLSRVSRLQSVWGGPIDDLSEIGLLIAVEMPRLILAIKNSLSNKGVRQRRTPKSKVLGLDIRPNVNMGLAPEIPYHLGAFDLPYVPDAIIADILLLVVGEVELVEVVGLDELHGLVSVFLAEGCEEVSKYLAQEPLLVCGKLGGRQPLQSFGRTLGLDCLVAAFPTAAFIEKGDLALLAVEGLVELVGPLSLEPVGVAGMIGSFVKSFG